ncbi:MAG: S8/S53 family peptidase [Rhodobacteraceae bacterium]|nr:S8/S53 family peptidase [Paracoccaceae bacterium]
MRKKTLRGTFACCVRNCLIYVTIATLVLVTNRGIGFAEKNQYNGRITDKAYIENKISKTGFVRVFLSLSRKDGGPILPKTKKQFLINQKIIANTVNELLVRMGKKFPIKNWAVRRFDGLPVIAATLSEAELMLIAEDGVVSQVSPDYLYIPHLQPSMKTIGADVVHHPSIGMTGRASDGTNQIIAIIDTGIDKSHQMLQGAVIYEGCFSTNDTRGLSPTAGMTNASLCPSGTDREIGVGVSSNCSGANIPGKRCQHGTAVASAAAGRGAVGFPRGAAPAADLISFSIGHRAEGDEIEIFASETLGALMEIYYWTLGIAQAPPFDRTKIAALNVSIGTLEVNETTEVNFHTCLAQVEARIMTKEVYGHLRDFGITPIVSAGNEGLRSRVSFPACLEETVTVSATGKVRSSTNEDEPEEVIWSGSNVSTNTDFFAPGVDIVAAASGTESGFFIDSGTSYAAPMLAGAIAAIKSIRNGMSNEAILNLLRNTGEPFALPLNADQTRPRINLRAAAAALGVSYTQLELGPVGAGSSGSSQILTTELTFTGPEISPTFHSLEVRNTGTTDMPFTILNVPSWITVTGTQNSPIQGGRATVVRIIPNSLVSQLPIRTHEVRLRIVNLDSGFGTQEILVRMVVGCEAPADNDSFENAVELSGRIGAISGHNCMATTQPGEPRHSTRPHVLDDLAGNSVWYKFTAPSTGKFFLLVSAWQGALVAAYEGNAIDNLMRLPHPSGIDTLISAPPFETNSVSINTQPDETYHFVVVGHRIRPSSQVEGNLNIGWINIPDN